MRVVIALGGNALIRRGGSSDLATQSDNVARAALAIAGVAAHHQVIVTHGNGPQIGLLALLDAFAPSSQQSPLDLLGAETDGMIGYLLERELINALGHARVATLLTQVEVRTDDPAFARPQKFIGPLYSEPEARRLATARGWDIAPDSGGWRRVVPSPEPHRIIEAAALQTLLRADFLTICAGGGGIPVTRGASQGLSGVECVVDKDLTSALLATTLEADVLLMLTDVDAVYANFGQSDAHPIRRATPQWLRDQRFAAGSMGPKVEAACRFSSAAGRTAYIGSLDTVADTLSGRAGTRVACETEASSLIQPTP